jgi:hypothetical protein
VWVIGHEWKELWLEDDMEHGCQWCHLSILAQAENTRAHNESVRAAEDDYFKTTAVMASIQEQADYLLPTPPSLTMKQAEAEAKMAASEEARRASERQQAEAAAAQAQAAAAAEAKVDVEVEAEAEAEAEAAAVPRFLASPAADPEVQQRAGVAAALLRAGGGEGLGGWQTVSVCTPTPHTPRLVLLPLRHFSTYCLPLARPRKAVGKGSAIDCDVMRENDQGSRTCD